MIITITSPLPAKHRVLLIDDHPIFCLGTTESINKEEDLEVCGSIELMKKAREAIDRLKPDLAIIDISLKKTATASNWCRN